MSDQLVKKLRVRERGREREGGREGGREGERERERERECFYNPPSFDSYFILTVSLINYYYSTNTYNNSLNERKYKRSSLQQFSVFNSAY